MTHNLIRFQRRNPTPSFSESSEQLGGHDPRRLWLTLIAFKNQDFITVAVRFQPPFDVREIKNTA